MARLIPEVIISGVELNLAVVDIRNLGADFVQKITVMRYYDYGVVKINQEFFQPCDSVQIQMVRRLVQKKDVRVAEERLRKQHFYLFRTV